MHCSQVRARTVTGPGEWSAGRNLGKQQVICLACTHKVKRVSNDLQDVMNFQLLSLLKVSHTLM